MKEFKERKLVRKVMAFALSAIMLLTVFSVAAFADTTQSDSNESTVTEVFGETGTGETSVVSQEEADTETASSDETQTAPSTPETTTPAETAPEETTIDQEPAPAVGDNITVDGFVYKIAENNTVIVKGFSANYSKSTVTIKNTIKYNGMTYKIVKVGSGAFRGNSKIKKVTIWKNTTEISKNAFRDCKNLKKVTMRAGIKTIRLKAFKNCKKLKTINITSTVLTDIKKDVFKNIYSKAVINVMNKSVRILIKSSVSSTVTVNKM